MVVLIFFVAMDFVTLVLLMVFLNNHGFSNSLWTSYVQLL